MVILQSYRNERVSPWLARCMVSVQQWAAASGFAYKLIDDDGLLGVLPDAFKQKVGARWPMLADLGRLLWCKKILAEGAGRVVWLDADVLICQPDLFQIPHDIADGYAFGREIWVESGGRIRYGAHNAICVFEPKNPILDFYIHSCLKIMETHAGLQLAPQLLGPKWLKLQHGMIQMHLLDDVAMWSPWVVDDLLAGGGMRLDKQLAANRGTLSPAVNLCASMLDDARGLKAVEILLGGILSTDGLR